MNAKQEEAQHALNEANSIIATQILNAAKYKMIIATGKEPKINTDKRKFPFFPDDAALVMTTITNSIVNDQEFITETQAMEPVRIKYDEDSEYVTRVLGFLDINNVFDTARLSTEFKENIVNSIVSGRRKGCLLKASLANREQRNGEKIRAYIETIKTTYECVEGDRAKAGIISREVELIQIKERLSALEASIAVDTSKLTLNDSQQKVVDMKRANPELSGSAIARALGINKGTVSRTLKKAGF